VIFSAVFSDGFLCFYYKQFIRKWKAGTNMLPGYLWETIVKAEWLIYNEKE